MPLLVARLERKDVNLEESLFDVRQAKKGRNRVVPLKSCGIERLTRCAALGPNWLARKRRGSFMKEDRMPASDSWMHYNFALDAKRLGLRKR